jgi:hypothetical protein
MHFHSTERADADCPGRFNASRRQCALGHLDDGTRDSREARGKTFPISERRQAAMSAPAVLQASADLRSLASLARVAIAPVVVLRERCQMAAHPMLR